MQTLSNEAACVAVALETKSFLFQRPHVLAAAESGGLAADGLVEAAEPVVHPAALVEPADGVAARSEWLGPVHLHCERSGLYRPGVASCDCEEFPGF